METQQQQQIRIAPEFIKNIDGKDFVLYAGLLDLAHKLGINQLNVEVLQFPLEENNFTAVCKAACYGKDGKVFIEVGDANPSNCNAKVAKHIIRMAATRAKARALRDYTNIGMTCLEELGDNDEIPASTPTQRSQPPQRQQAPKKDKPQGNSERKYTGNPPPMSDAQRRAITNICKRRGVSETDLENIVTKMYGIAESFDTLNIRDASALIDSLQSDDFDVHAYLQAA